MRTIPSILSLTLRSTIMAVAVMGTLWAQTTTGKIAGRVVDSATGDPIPGANVLIDGTTLGAATDANGDYFIIAVPPGVYDVRAQVIGYATIIQSEVRVLLNLTTFVDFSMSVEAIAGEEVRVVAERPVVQPDVSANVANIEAEEMENLPVAGVSEFINLQAGIEPGMTIRGMGTAGLGFIVDGTTMRDGRSNTPFSSISYTAIDEVQIQTGGFNAEYGNVRSGVINVITKVPSADRYMADVMLRYSPPHSQVFGDGPDLVDGPNSFYIRPYMDDAVAWKGTEDIKKEDVTSADDYFEYISPWDRYTQRQYPTFMGWNKVSTGAKLDDDITGVKASTYLNNLRPEQYQEVFKWHHRKELEIKDPEYDVDLSLGGPVIPVLSRSLGNLRFLASYRKTQDPYMVPMERNARVDETFQLKLMADLGANMKLQVNGLYGTHSGIAYRASRIVGNPMPQWGGVFSYPWGTGWDEHVNWVPGDGMYGKGRHCVTDVTRQQLGAVFTHTLSPSTFYKLSLTRMNSDYDTGEYHRRRRLKDPTKPYVDPEDTLYVEKLATIDSLYAARALDSLYVMVDSAGNPVTTPDSAVYDGYYFLDEAPFGTTWYAQSGPGSMLRLGAHWGRARDTSSIAITTAKFDLTNQTTSWSQLRAGLELNFYDFDMRYMSNDSMMAHPDLSKAHWQRKAMQAAFYVQEKLEFRGMIANLGLRLDYYDPGKDWWDYTTYDQLFINANYGSWGQGSGSVREEAFEARGLKTLDKQVALSPRVGVSFPITAASKLFFNYGHFRDIPNQRQMFQIQTRWAGGVLEIGNPELPLLKTVAYELGYEHSLLDQYLLRLSGYYQDRSNQPNEIEYWSVDNEVWYLKYDPVSYGDVRGLEVTLNKTRGKFMRGFVNYTYMIEKSGNFGFLQAYENPMLMGDYARKTRDHYQSKPVSQPFGRLNLDFFAPPNFGPAIAGIHPLGDWRLDLLGSWRAGQTYTWAGPGGVMVPGLTNNVRIRDFTSLDIRLSKNFDTGIGRAQFFVDITNVLNLKYLYFSPWGTGTGPFSGDDMYAVRDYDEYMTSLHLPEETWEEFEQTYPHPFGDDRPGDYRPAGVAFVPIEAAADFESLPDFIIDEVDDVPVYEYLEPDRRVLGWAADTWRYYEFNKTTHVWEVADKSFVDDVLDDRAYIDMPNRMYRAFQNPRSILFGLRVWF